MNIRTLSASCENTYIYDILDGLSVQVRERENPYKLPIDAFFEMAARKNKKRGFLFVSKLLGKHIPIHPALPLLSSRLLACQFAEKVLDFVPEFTEYVTEAIRQKQSLTEVYENLQEETISLPVPMTFIGFAETATALGHGFFDCFENAAYIHTTREELAETQPFISFEEEHSHATAHRCYAQDARIFDNENPIVLIDDEMTTGKTTVNIIRSIQEKYPRQEYYTVSLLDWRSEENRLRFRELEEELQIRIKTISLLSGTIEVYGSPTTGGENHEPECRDKRTFIERNHIPLSFSYLPYTSIDGSGKFNKNGFMPCTGRFGIESSERTGIFKAAKTVGRELKSLRRGERALCLGTGEFMYFPMLVSVHMGEGVSCHSTTRSPVHPVKREGYAVQHALQFASPTDPSVNNFVYNIPRNGFDEIFVFLERDEATEQMDSMLSALSATGIETVHLIIFSSAEKGGEK